MAEFSLGLTKTAVEGTLSLVKSAVEKEKRLKEKVQNDLVFISGELEMMQSFLRDANSDKKDDQVVRLTWVRQLRNLAFDVEDCVEYVVHLDLDKSSVLGGLRRLWQTVNCRAPPLPLDVAVAEIKQLKDRVEYASQRSTRYNLTLHGSNNNNKQQPEVSVVMTPAEHEHPPSSTPTFHIHILRDAWRATDKLRYINMCHFQQRLLIDHEYDLRVISIWGSGSGVGDDGPGTASILEKVYCDPKTYENFKIRAWVKLTHPFNHDEFLKSLLAQFYASSSNQAKNAGVDFCAWMKAEVIEADNLMQQMSEQRYLVVLEDVLTVAEWDVIRMYLPDSKNGSRILLSTPQLGIALLCTGEPYQVWEFGDFSSDKQFFCAFSKRQKTERDIYIGEFYRQLSRGHSVISVWGADDDDKSNLIDILYRGIINGLLEEIDGVVADKSDHADKLCKSVTNMRRKIDRQGTEFERELSSWVHVPDPFDLKVFARRLFLKFFSDDIRAQEITEVGRKGEVSLIDWCREILSVDYPYVVVIYGLRSKGDWDRIESAFFSSEGTRANGCILVITNEETVATHCVKDHHTQHLAFNAKDLEVDPSISTLIRKGCWHYAIHGRKGNLFYDRGKDAREWASRFKNVGGRDNPDPVDEGNDDGEGFRVFMVKGWHGNSEKGVLRHAYYGALLHRQIERRNWVDVPVYGFDLRDFSWRLLLDFYSDDPRAKEAVAVDLMEGNISDPIQECLKILRNQKCLVVIDGLEYLNQWHEIKDEFFSEKHILESIIIIGSSHPDMLKYDFYQEAKELRLGTQEQGRLIDMQYRRIFSTQRYRGAIQWVERCRLVGRDSEVSTLGWLLKHKSLVSVWGIPGVGKSTLVRTIYYNEILYSPKEAYDPFESLKKQPFEAFAWVDVPSPFNLIEFACRLLLDFYYDDPLAMESVIVSMVKEGRQFPILECCKVLRTGKCLVIMDGLCSKQDWDLIKDTFLGKDIVANIVVITNEEEVAMHCVENQMEQAINITRLEANAALSLLEKIAWENEGLTSYDEKMKISKSIVGKCGGLPKVIAAIGAVCRSSPIWDLESLTQIDNFTGVLETDPMFHSLRSLFSWMKSYFDGCSDSLKPCIYYLSIFSAEKNIRRRRLLWRWIAEGYCRDTSDGKTCEENWEIFVSELVNLSIIQWSASSKVFCQINGFFHEYITSRPMEDNLVFTLAKGCSLNSTRGGQHLTIRSTWDRRDRIVYESIDFSRLRSLTVFGKWESFFISSKNVNMRLLRVLDLEDATHVTNEEVEQIAKLLPRLKFLSLRGCREITCLPSSLACLRQLQTIDIRHTSIVTLPIFITKLQKLRYIRAGTTEAWDWEGDVILVPEVDGEEDRASAAARAQVTNLSAAAATIEAAPAEGGTDCTGPVLPAETAGSSVSCNNMPRTLASSLLSKLCRRGGVDNGGVMVPADIGKLAVLHTLGVVMVNAQCSKDMAIFQELKKLRQLRKLGVSGINKGNIKKFCEAIADHAHLRSLSVELDKDDALDDNIPEPPKTIKTLKLYGRVHRLLLVWMEHLDNLEKLHLTIEKPEQSLDLPELSNNNPWIRHLRIRPIQDGDLHLRRCCWRATRVVEIQCSSLLHIKFDGGDSSWDVRVLKVHFSGGSQSSLQISGLSQLRFLKEVWLKGFTDAHKQYMQRQIGDIPKHRRPVLKLVRPRSS